MARGTEPAADTGRQADTGTRSGTGTEAGAGTGTGTGTGAGAGAGAGTAAPPAPDAGAAPGEDTGAYEVLRARLDAEAAELARRAEELNERRTAEFGETRLALTGTGDLRTPENCAPADLVAVGEALLLGHHGARRGGGDAVPGDVFALYDRQLAPLPASAVPGLLDDPAFVREFAALHRYFRGTRLLRLVRTEGRLLAVFRTGEAAGDVRVLRWSLTAAGEVSFLDAQGERDQLPTEPYDFTWQVPGREHHVPGRHPHVRVEDLVWVGTTGGLLTVKTRDDTTDQRAEYSEPVEEPLQSLADAEIAYARVGVLLLLKVRPYKERADRHLVFHTLTGEVLRLDGIGQSCRRLPEDQGIVFPGGYVLATGAHKVFGTGTGDLRFVRLVRSPYGEDVLYVFRDEERGRELLLPYNLIRKQLATPLECHGHALFDDGTLVTSRAAGEEGARVHPVQLWRTPFVADTFAAARPPGSGPLARIGNADLVSGIADCLSLTRAVAESSGTASGYEALAAACTAAADRHHWLAEPELGALAEPLERLRATAGQVLAEFATVRELTREAAESLAETEREITAVVRRLRGESPREATAWVDGLTALRRARGRLLTLKDLRYADRARIAELDARTEEDLAGFGRRATASLARADAFASAHAELAALDREIAAAATVAATEPLATRLDELTAGLQTVTEVLASLGTSDATVRTAVLERLAEVSAGVNRGRAALDARRRALGDTEQRAEFAAEFALLGQSATAALATAHTPEECEQQLAGMLLHVENLESRFASSADFLTELDAQRTEIHEAFSARKQSLADARARHAARLAQSAARVLETVGRRASALGSPEEVATWFVSDPMAAKVRRTAAELRELGEQARAQELDGQLESARRAALRAVRDRGELGSAGGARVRLGRHLFAVNSQPLDLTLVPREEGLVLSLTGTDWTAPVTDPDFLATRHLWDRPLPSESPAVYRAEYLAVRLFETHGPAALAAADLPGLARTAAEEAYDEGYARGVHDHDAALILAALLRLHEQAGVLRHEPAARARAQLHWAHRTTPAERADLTRRARSLARAREAFGPGPALDDFRGELAAAIRAGEDEGAAPGGEAGDGAARAAAYLFEELTGGPEGFVLSARARTLLEKFRRGLGTAAYEEDLAALDKLTDRHQLVEAWLSAWAHSSGEELTPGDLAEAVAAELCPELVRHPGDAPLTETVTGLRGAHPRVDEGALRLRLDELLARVGEFTAREVPEYRAYQRRRTQLVAGEREKLRLGEFRPRVLSTFVRGRLVDEVYLPLIGDSLAKQLGTVDGTGGAGTGGLLMLVSPPGYGKTTLLEYVAERLGLVLVRISGPALGDAVTSLDPAEAPGAAARQEIEKINFALAAGSNTLLYLDDIQHTSPRFLEKFIPLCDATRRIEGVRDGRPRTYDLRGKRFAVCMAGNPYTASGARFQVPDMLANRADVWNLGEVLTGKEEVFARSFVENALTAHPVLAPLAERDRTELDRLLRLASGSAGGPGGSAGGGLPADPAAVDALADGAALSLPPAEVEQILAVLRLLMRARETVLAVNGAYLASALQSDGTRSLPPFQLQGSYRNMNKIAQRIQPVMNTRELDALVADHYAAEAQTLTTGAEANLLRLAALRGTLSPEQAARWEELCTAWRARGQGGDGEPLARAVAALDQLADRLAAIESVLGRAMAGGGSRRRDTGAVDEP
ncbi:large glycine/alanine rich protein [Streptomyces albus]|uniref:Large glycine/alanine rich protein n=1 Tax=Streptomyces albus (strain ATCC 21838 / DSM 41398 / FERM P-419 / JCM 4703 / NBRC 107858) TaxID=1081613 RepID=A0A0B5ELY8_STRA4|nr:large glycine/alanine rich protein [Streptomyces albus]AOU77757.1 large glycine/alanine rich protein [Streptomyces albus]